MHLTDTAQPIFNSWFLIFAATMETAMQRRKRLDHERYMRNREARLFRQRMYYSEHREHYARWRKQRAESERRKLFDSADDEA